MFFKLVQYGWWIAVRACAFLVLCVTSCIFTNGTSFYNCRFRWRPSIVYSLYPVFLHSVFCATLLPYLTKGEARNCCDNSEFAICHAVRHGNVNSIHNPSTVTNPTIEPYCIFLSLTLPCRTTCKIANSLVRQFITPCWTLCIVQKLFYNLKDGR